MGLGWTRDPMGPGWDREGPGWDWVDSVEPTKTWMGLDGKAWKGGCTLPGPSALLSAMAKFPGPESGFTCGMDTNSLNCTSSWPNGQM